MSTQSKTEDFFECINCNRNSLKDRWCPCPRTDCDAEKVGTVTVTTTINRTVTGRETNRELGQSTII